MSDQSAAIHTDTSTAALLAVVARRPLHPVVFIFVLGGLAALGPFTMDLYLPAFPSVQQSLHTTEAMVQLTLTATAIGLGLGQLIVGPLSDALGRRSPLVTATGLHIVSSIAVAVAPTIEVVTAARLGQGFGAAAGSVVAAAMVRDLFGGRRLVRMAARIALVSGIAPVVAPIIGSQLLRVTDWRGVFWILALFGGVVFIAVVALIPETLPRSRRAAVERSWPTRISTLLTDRVYVGTVFVGAMVFAAIVSYLSAAPFIFQNDLGFTEQAFGLMFGINAVGLLAATQLAAALMRRVRPATLLCWALPTMLLSGAGLVVAGVCDAGWGWVVVFSALLVALHGFCGPCLHILLLARHQAESGTAVALSGFVYSIAGGVLSLVPSALGGVGVVSLGAVVAASAVTGIAVLLAVVRPWSTPSLSAD